MVALKTLAIFGGTFDPVHNGHLQSALELKQSLALDELRLLPCHIPPHRQSPRAKSQHRLEMVRLATRHTELQVDDRELRRDCPSYSVETLEQLRAEMGSMVSLSWVMGTDAFSQLDHWYRWQELLSLAHIIVMTRSNEMLPKLGPVAELIKRHQSLDETILSRQAAGSIIFIALKPYPISATEIRAALIAQQPVDQVLPANVLHYIQQHRLYVDADTSIDTDIDKK